MGEQEPPKVVETETPVEHAPPPPPPVVAPAPAPVTETVSKDVSDEKSLAVCPPTEEKVDDSKALAIVESKDPDALTDKSSGGSLERDAALTRVETDKRLSLIKAWEENEKTKAMNKATKKLSSIGSWENAKKAAVENDLKAIEEKLEKKKAAYVEKMKNKIALLHKEAEERRAMVEAKRGEDLIKAEEMACKYRAKGEAPKKLFGCIG